MPLLFPQEDLILPHHFSFYELIINKARGKSGPLFDFGVKDDIRILGDAGVESQDVHAGKVGGCGGKRKCRCCHPCNSTELL